MTAVRALGIDYGNRRIGLALSDASGTLATPLRTLERPKSQRDTVRLLGEAIASLAGDGDGLATVVVGWPRHLDGTPTAHTAEVEALARALEQVTTLPVVLQDERLSSREAESRLALNERDWRKRKGKLDAAAAAIILQDFLDGQQRA